ncbi:MAG TPA: OmpA family protein, partial [Bacteroidia bacterium]
YLHRFSPYIMDGKASDPLKKEVSERMNECEQGKMYSQHVNEKILVENLGNTVNSEYAEYAPVVNEGDSVLLFTARNKNNTGNKRDYRDEKFFEDMYIAHKSGSTFGKPEKFTQSDKYVGLIPNSRMHDAVVSLSLDEKQLITYKENKLWISQLKDAKWTGPEVLPQNINVGKYQPHASLGKDGKTIYFSSDKPGGYGGLDIYMCMLGADGKWSEPVNLGPTVNTERDEDSPTLSFDDKVLFFSSKGHSGIGGYDIYKSVWDASSGKWGEAENMGVPVNSAGDDIYYKPSNDGTHAYFASYRVQGLGDMDIYRQGFVKKPLFGDCIPVKDLSHIRTLLYFDIHVKDTIRVKESTTFEASGFSSGIYSFNGYAWQIENNSIIDSSKVEHTFLGPGTYTIKVSVFGVDKIKTDQIEFCLSREVQVLPENGPLVVKNETDSIKLHDKGGQLELQNIYYSFGSPGLDKKALDILDKNIQLLNQYPSVMLVVRSGTDSRGSKEFNKRLSKKRADAVVSYMVAHGIDKKRIVQVVALGEDGLVNDCADGKECSNEQHSQNRRTEFQVVKKK